MKRYDYILLIVALIGISWFFIVTTKGSNIDVKNSKDYLTKMKFTNEQIDYTLSKCDEVRDCTHFIKWFGAINRHEVGGTFVDGKTNYLAGRLKKNLYFKPFKKQVDGRVEAYNKYRYKNNTVDDRLDKSRYCVSDTHGGGVGCPNWRTSVPLLMTQRGDKQVPIVEKTMEKQVEKIKWYNIAKKKQTIADKQWKEAMIKKNEADEAWRQCKKSGECKD